MQEKPLKKDWQYYLGILIFIVANLLPIIALIVVPILGTDHAISTVLYSISIVGGPEILLVVSAAILGKDNIEKLLSYLGKWLANLISWDNVSKTRHAIGVWLLAISIIIPFVFFNFFPETLEHANKAGWGFYTILISEIIFIVSFFTLGGPFWKKLYSLFRYDK
jgi:hypothetical protein